MPKVRSEHHVTSPGLLLISGHSAGLDISGPLCCQGGYHWRLPRSRGLCAEERFEAVDEAKGGSAGSVSAVGTFGNILKESKRCIFSSENYVQSSVC